MNVLKIPNRGTRNQNEIEVRKSPSALTFPASMWIALAYLLVLAATEILTVFIEPRAGLVVYGLLLIAILSLAALPLSLPRHQLLLALALPPLSRLLSLSLLLRQLPILYWYLAIGIPLFLAAFLVARVAQLTPAMVGLTRRFLAWQVLIGLSGIGLGYIEYFILRPAPMVAEFRWQQIWLPALILLVFTGLLEEVIYRGVILSAAMRSMGRMGVLFVSMVFVIMHLGYRSAIELMFVLGVALFFGFVARRTGSILGVTLSHGLINISLFLIYPFLVGLPASPAINPPNMSLDLAAPTAASSLPATASPVPSLSTPPGQSSPTATALAYPTAAATHAGAMTPMPALSFCAPPPNEWIVVSVLTGDTLAGMAQVYDATLEKLKRANCFINDKLILGAFMFIPGPPPG